MLGISSWLAINAVWAELPIFARVLPEGWEIGTYLSLILQLANIFPASYLYLQHKRKNKDKKQRAREREVRLNKNRNMTIMRQHGHQSDIAHANSSSADYSLSIHNSEATGERVPVSDLNSKSQYQHERNVIYVVLGVGLVSTVCLALYWGATFPIKGHAHSVPLFVFMLLAGAVDCMTSVVFWPFIARLAPAYTTALCVGEALSGLLPSMLGNYYILIHNCFIVPHVVVEPF